MALADCLNLEKIAHQNRAIRQKLGIFESFEVANIAPLYR